MSLSQCLKQELLGKFNMLEVNIYNIYTVGFNICNSLSVAA